MQGEQVKRQVFAGLSRLVDPTIILSFDRTGFAIHSRAFAPGDLDVDLRGRVCLVTGANSGIGKATSQELARRGATVYMLCRDRERGEAAWEAIRRETGSRAVHLELVDLASHKSIRAFVERFEAPRVDVLIHNAGLLPHERIETPDGLELTLAVHVAGPFLLTQMVRPRLLAAPEGRIVWVSSGGMYGVGLSLKDVQWRDRKYDGVRAYAQTKRMQVVLNELLAKDLAGTRVTTNAMHPGWVDTPGVKRWLPGFYRLFRTIFRTPAQGADTSLWLAVCPGLGQESGGFWFDRKRRHTHYLPWTRESREERRELWDLCHEWAGLEAGDRRLEAGGRDTR